jgi:hypothetical protein
MNSQTLEAQSEVERAGIEDTIREIKRRLTPGQLVDEVLAYTKDGGGQFLSNLGNQATGNPLPVTLIGAGLVWFLFSQKNGGGGISKTVSSASWVGENRTSSTTENGGRQDNSIAEYVERGLEHAADVGRQGIDTINDGSGHAASSLSTAAHSVSAGLSSGGAAAKEFAAEVEELADRSGAFIREHPLVLLGAGVAIGALLGAAVPVSVAEVSIMGEPSRDMQKDAMNAASNQADKLTEAGTHLFQEVSRTVKEEVSQFVSGNETDRGSSAQVQGSERENSST